MVLFIGFFLLLASLLISVELFLGLAFLCIPTTIVFIILFALGVHIAFWQVYLLVFIVLFVINLL